MVFNKFKKKILESSDSYNFYKESYEKFDKKIKEHDEILLSYNKLFNALYLNFELTPTPFFRNIREIGYELLKFVDNICEKYDLEWWFDGGTLLGAVRHGDYIPWDDDLDIGMMRSDYNKLVDVIDEEIKNNNLKNVTATFKKEAHYRWIQIHYQHPDFNEKIYSFMGLDIFPFDYIKDYDGHDIEDEFQQAREVFNQENSSGVSYDVALKNCYDALNMSFERTSHYIPGVEGTHGPVNLYDLVVMESDKLFPLKRMKFGDNLFPVPNDCDDYLKAIYGDSYMAIPKNVRDHGRSHRLRTIDNINEYLDEALLIFKNANENYK